MISVAFAMLLQASGPSAADGLQWLRRPTAEHLAHHYPDKAQREGVEGSATVECGVTGVGSMTGCRVLNEDPAGYGFGEAALAMSAYFRLGPADGTEPMSGGKVKLPIRFALPSPTTGSPSVIVNPDWQRRPSGRDVANYYPKAALREDLAGRATITCTVSVDGRLTDCRAVSEEPTDAGFGAAAVAMSQLFRMRPQTRDGRPVANGIVRIPMTFLMPANLRAAPVPARHPEVKAEIVELDCRFRDLHLDNCFARGGSTAKAAEAALKLAEDVTLPPLPTARRQGRIVMPLVFTDAAGGVSAPDVVTRPIWHDRPSMLDVYRAYPAAAKATGVVGNVVVECRMQGRGPLGPCTIARETPAGLGFGAAALTIMGGFKADEVDAFGLKVEGRKVFIPVRFSAAPPPTRGSGTSR